MVHKTSYITYYTAFYSLHDYISHYTAFHTFIAQVDNTLYIQSMPPLAVEYMLGILGK